MALEDIRHHKEEADLAKAIEESTKDVQEPAAQTPKPQPQPASQPVPRRSPQPAPQPVSQRVLQPASQPASRPAPSTAPRRRPASPSPLAELFRNPLIVNTEGEGPRLPTPRSLSGLLRDRRPDQGVQVDSGECPDPSSLCVIHDLIYLTFSQPCHPRSTLSSRRTTLCPSSLAPARHPSAIRPRSARSPRLRPSRGPSRPRPRARASRTKPPTPLFRARPGRPSDSAVLVGPSV
jgi:hypothetical protein